MDINKLNRRKFLAWSAGGFFSGISNFDLFPDRSFGTEKITSSSKKGRGKKKTQKFSDKATSLSNNLLVLENPKPFRMEVSFKAEIEGTHPESLVIALPVPQTNEYQQISDFDFPEEGLLRTFSENGSRYLLLQFTPDNPFHPFKMRYDAVLYDIRADWSRLGEFHPYNKKSEIYQRYTGSSGDCVDPKNTRIKNIAAELDAASSNPLEFAHRAYLYVSDHFQYRDPDLNLIPLSEVLRNGGGHCGNLTSVFVSLLRAQGIPARHLTGKRPGIDTDYNSCHIWSDFYLEGYGWIPVDVSQRTQAKRKGDWFGQVFPSTGLIVNHGANMTVFFDGNRKKVQTLQNYFYNFRYRSRQSPRIVCSLLYKKTQVR